MSCSPTYSCTHLGNLAKQRAAEMKTVGIECIVLPMNVHSYHNGYIRNAADLDYMINSLQLNAKDVIEMHRAYLSDDTEYLSVPIKLVCRIIALNDVSDIPSDVVKKVEAWRDAMFFAETLHDTEFPILYTPAAMQLLLWPDPPEDDTDLSKHHASNCHTRHGAGHGHDSWSYCSRMRNGKGPLHEP